MSWTNTYTHTIAVAVDVFTASIIWDTYGVTVSSRCGLALRRGQTGLLATLGKILNKIQDNHCELAIKADIQRAQDALKFLGTN